MDIGKKKNRLNNILWALTIFKMRYNRGNSWMNQIKDVMQTIISLYAAKTLFAGDINFWFIHINIASLLTGKLIILIGIGEIFLGYLIGAADELKLLLWQRENTYGSRNINPVFKKMEEEHTDLRNSTSEINQKIDTLMALFKK